MSKKKMSTREKIDISHELRQWLGLGVAGTALYTTLNPEGAREGFKKVKGMTIKFKDKVVDTFNSLKKKF